MAPSSATKAQRINNLQKVEQRKMKKTKTKVRKKKQESSSKTHHRHHHELSGGEDHNVKKEEEDDNICSSDGGGCCTPKADRFKIPEILSCPPAPKKTRVLQNFSSIRSPIAFFSSPDIDSFFSSLRNISA